MPPDVHISAASTTPSVSVVIPAFTLERWDLIKRAVESARAQTHPPEMVVLCIDNNDSLLQRAREEWGAALTPHVRIVPNERSDHLTGRTLHLKAHGTLRRFGAGSARNTGASLVQSDIIAFIDDDAWAEPDWLEQLVAVYETYDVVAVGGAADPYYESARPPWFPANFDWVFGCSYAGLPTRPAPLLHLIGSNMSVTRAAFASIGGFIGSDFDDLNLCMRLAERFGARSLYYSPEAVVHHYVPSQRVTWRYFYRRCYFVNREKVRVLRRIGPAGNLKAERAFVRRTMLHDVTAAVGQALRGEPAALLQAGAMVVGIGLAGTGYIHGKLRRHTEAHF